MKCWSDKSLIFNVLDKKSEMKLDIKFYEIFRWGKFSRGDTIDLKKVLTGDTIQGGTFRAVARSESPGGASSNGWGYCAHPGRDRVN